MKAQFQKLGVTLTIKNAPDILDTNMPGFDFQTLIFAWVAAPDPYGGNVIWLSSAIPQQCSLKQAKKFACDYSGQNYTKVRDPKVDELLNASDAETDPVARAALFNQADLQLATNDVTVIPLFQKPTQLGYQSSISGVQDNATQDGFTWNIEDWTYAPTS
jgi:ABC-type transport system substrate-binding protein